MQKYLAALYHNHKVTPLANVSNTSKAEIKSTTPAPRILHWTCVCILINPNVAYLIPDKRLKVGCNFQVESQTLFVTLQTVLLLGSREKVL
jgi:hypothetical protein